jgi:hypothetical protein
MSQQRQAAIRRLRREAEVLRKAIELEFSRTGASSEQVNCRRAGEDIDSGGDLPHDRSSTVGTQRRPTAG